MKKSYELESIIGTGKLIEIDTDNLRPSPCNTFEMNDMDEMKSSIMSAGLVTPLSVIGPDGDGRYEIISGERRYTALRALEKEGTREKGAVPCYVIGGVDMNETEKRLLITVANITSRGGDAIHSHRLEVVRLLKELEDSDPEKYGSILSSAKKFLKVSDRYSRMYKQIFRQADDELKELAASGNIRINDASRLSSLPKEIQKAAVKEVKKVEDAKSKSAIVSKYTHTTNQEIDQKEKSNREQPVQKDNKLQKYDVTPAELERGDYDYLLDDFNDAVRVDVDNSGYINRQKQEDAQSYEESYQSKLTSVIDWAEKMLKKSDPSDEEWDAIDACKRVAEKFQ